MITSFEVGAVFKILDEASPALKEILKQVRALNKAVQDARKNLAALSKGLAGELNGAVGETERLAAAWRSVAIASGEANKTMREAAIASRRTSVPSVAGGGSGGRGGNARAGVFGRSGSGGVHVSSAGMAIPGGHARFSGSGTAGMFAGGLAADAIYQASELQKEAFLTWWHSGMADTPGSQQTIRDLIQDATSSSGYGFKEVGEASEEIFRLMKGTPGNGLSIAPELLRAGSTESLIKGTGLKESVKSIVEMAHMMGVYDPEQLKAMAPVIGFLSTANPASLPQMGRSASYSVPTLSNALGINAADVLFENTAIARAGATGSKSGTWVEHAFDRALPPDRHVMSAGNYARRMWSMREAGLVDENGKSTVMSSDGKSIDVDKFLNTARQALEKLPIALRNSVEKSVFGEQGARGFELMTSPKVMDQTHKLKEEMPGFTEKYNSFLEQYSEKSSIQKARSSYAEFNNLMSDLGSFVLPGVIGALRDFQGALKEIRGWLPGADGKSSAGAQIGTRAVEFGLLGAGVGSVLPGVGTLVGAATGGGVGGLYGWVESIRDSWRPTQQLGEAAKETGTEAWSAAGALKGLSGAINSLFQGISHGIGIGGGAVPPAPKNDKEGMIHNDLHIDGTRFASVMTKYQMKRAYYPTEGSAHFDATRGAYTSDHAFA